MAENSKRERIIVYHVDLMKVLESINHIRRTIPSYDELKNFSSQQFPVIAVTARLPVPVVKKTGMTQSGRGPILSSLNIDNFVYIQNNVNPDTQISDVLDDIWAKGYSDPTYGGLTTEVDLTAEEEVIQWPPFQAFRVVHQVKYYHTTGGI